eukprot:scaffold14898_cov20-Tisochrysis_lutea.AAC.3
MLAPMLYAHVCNSIRPAKLTIPLIYNYVVHTLTLRKTCTMPGAYTMQVLQGTISSRAYAPFAVPCTKG